MYPKHKSKHKNKERRYGNYMDNNLVDNTVEQIKHIINDCIEKKGQFVISAGCGLGKSTAVNQLLQESEQGILFLTNTKLGIERVINENDDIYYFQSSFDDRKPFNSKIKECDKHKHVAMTAQLFELLETSTIKRICKNRILIIDEKVSFNKFIEIDSGHIGKMISLSDQEKISDTKEYKEYRETIKYLYNDFVAHTDKHFKNKDELVIIKHKREHNSNILNKIKKVLKQTKSKELQSYLERLYSLYTDDGILVYTKGGKISCYILQELHEKYAYPETTIVLDATARLEFEYKLMNFELVKFNQQSEIENNRRLNVRLYDYNVSISRFRRGDKELRRYIKHTIKNGNYDLIISHKEIIDFIVNECGYTGNTIYYGNEKGCNNSRLCSNALVLGLPRLNEIEYLLKYYVVFYDQLLEKKHGDDLSSLVIKDTYSYNFINRVMSEIMNLSIRQQVVQAIFRSNIRVRDGVDFIGSINTNIVASERFHSRELSGLTNIDLLGCNNAKGTNVDFTIEETKIKPNKTNIEMVIEFMETIEGEINRKEIEKSTGLNANQLKKVFSSNVMKNYVKENFEEKNTKPKRYIRKH